MNDGLINVSDELIQLSKDIVRIIEEEDREYNFRKNKGLIERNITASKFKKNLMGLKSSDIDKIINT